MHILIIIMHAQSSFNMIILQSENNLMIKIIYYEWYIKKTKKNHVNNN